MVVRRIFTLHPCRCCDREGYQLKLKKWMLRYWRLAVAAQIEVPVVEVTYVARSRANCVFGVLDSISLSFNDQ